MKRFLFLLPQRLLLGAVRGYRLLLSPWLGSGCRFEPTCSLYALDALERHGAVLGSGLTLHRIGRCHPWCEGGLDPVPDASYRLFARWRSPAHGPSIAAPQPHPSTSKPTP